MSEDYLLAAFEVREMPGSQVRLTLHLARDLESYDKKQFDLVSCLLRKEVALRLAIVLDQAAWRSNRSAWTDSADPSGGPN